MTTEEIIDTIKPTDTLKNKPVSFKFKDNPAYIAAVAIVTKLQQAGFNAYLVGGCVRDMNLNIMPKDFDVATNAHWSLLGELFQETARVGKSFAVTLVTVNDQPIQVARFRSDGKYGEELNGEVLATVEEDMKHRDITINGMYFDPVTEICYDHVGAAADLLFRVIRAIGDPDERFAEDPLRMLRVVRFACTLPDFEVDKLTLASIAGNTRLISTLSPERIGPELTKILTSGEATYGFQLMIATGLMYPIIPDLPLLGLVQQDPTHHPEGDVLTHTLKMLDGLRAGCSPTLAWAVLLHDIGKFATQSVNDEGRIQFIGHEMLGADFAGMYLTELKFSNEFVDDVATLVGQHMKMHHLLEMRTAKVRRLLGQKNFAELLELHFLDVMASSGDLSNYDFAVKTLETTPEEFLRPPSLVNGDDLIARGLTPGPVFGVILGAIKEEQYEGRITNREQALRVLNSVIAMALDDRMKEEAAVS